MRKTFMLPLAALMGCSTTQMAAQQPTRIYHSAESRHDVRECLLNRVSSSEAHVRKQELPGVSRVIVKGALGSVLLVFDIRDEAHGSVIEMHRLSSITPGRSNAESCF